MAVVYLHKRNDTNEVFYVGIGVDKKRAFEKRKRNAHWYNVVDKVGYTVDILVSDTPWEDACKIEKLLIEKYGRRDLGLGALVNMTDGGDGTINISEETRQKIGLYQRNKEGVKGYTFDKSRNKYQAQIMIGGKKIKLGRFNTPEEAELAYKQAKLNNQ